MLAIQRADPQKYDLMMDAMVEQSFMSEQKQTPLSLEKIRQADKQTSELIRGFPTKTQLNEPGQENLPTANYKLELF